MGKRQNAFVELLRGAGYSIASGFVRAPSKDVLAGNEHWPEIIRVYETLGGRLENFPKKTGDWDIQVGSVAVESVAIELDEECHFNRYRLITLQSPLYSELPSFPLNEYRHYAAIQEAACLATARYGGYWSNEHCERQFGPSANPGDLASPGSSRWKQRAFYDFLKDVWPLVSRCYLARISMWDIVSIHGRDLLIDEALRSVSSIVSDEVVSLVEKRAGVSLPL